MQITSVGVLEGKLKIWNEMLRYEMIWNYMKLYEIIIMKSFDISEPKSRAIQIASHIWKIAWYLNNSYANCVEMCV